MSQPRYFVSPCGSDSRRKCLRTETVNRTNSVNTRHLQAMQLPIEGGATHAERSGGRRDIAIGAGKRALQHAAFRTGKTFMAPARSAEQVRRRQRLTQACLGQSECL